MAGRLFAFRGAELVGGTLCVVDSLTELLPCGILVDGVIKMVTGNKVIRVHQLVKLLFIFRTLVQPCVELLLVILSELARQQVV